MAKYSRPAHRSSFQSVASVNGKTVVKIWQRNLTDPSGEARRPWFHMSVAKNGVVGMISFFTKEEQQSAFEKLTKGAKGKRLIDSNSLTVGEEDVQHMYTYAAWKRESYHSNRPNRRSSWKATRRQYTKPTSRVTLQSL